jgi:hypothetical protein
VNPRPGHAAKEIDMTISELLELFGELEEKGYGDCSLFVDSFGGLNTKDGEYVIASAVGFCKDFTAPKNALVKTKTRPR